MTVHPLLPHHVSRWDIVEAMRDLFGVEMSVGAVQAICEEVSEAVAPAVARDRRSRSGLIV